MEAVVEAAAPSTGSSEEEVGRWTACAALREFFSLPPDAVGTVFNGGKALKAPPQLSLETLGSSKCASCLELLSLFEVLGLSCPAPRRHSVITAATQRLRKTAAAGPGRTDDTSQTRCVRLHALWDRLHNEASLLERARPPKQG